MLFFSDDFEYIRVRDAYFREILLRNISSTRELIYPERLIIHLNNFSSFKSTINYLYLKTFLNVILTLRKIKIYLPKIN